MSDSKIYKEENLTVRDHMDPDKHWIGETLPVPTQSEIAATVGNVSGPGDSPIPARADHLHKLGTGVVGTTNIADNAITSAKIADNAIGASEIAAGAVGSSEIANPLTAALVVGSGNNEGTFGGGNVVLVRDNTSVWPIHIRHQDSTTTTIYLAFQYGGTTIGSIIRNGTNNGVVYQVSSWREWKHDEGPITDEEAIENLMKYRPRKYRHKYNDEGIKASDGTHLSEEVERGFFADEVEEVAPWAVSETVGEEGDEMFMPAGVDYGRITPDLVASIQALVRKVEVLEAKVEELSGKAA